MIIFFNYRALDLGTGEVVAVKRIKFDDGELDKEITVSLKIGKKFNTKMKTLMHFFFLSLERSILTENLITHECHMLFGIHSKQTSYQYHPRVSFLIYNQISYEACLLTVSLYIYIYIRYAENGSLMSTLKSFGAFPEKLVCSFCVKILNGLEYLHSNDVSIN